MNEIEAAQPVRPLPSGESPRRDPLRWLAGLTLLAACAFCLATNSVDPDLWGHVQYGRDALAEGLPRTNTYSYTATGYRWINHENLSELALAAVADTAGPAGLMLLKVLLGVAICGLVFASARRKGVSPTLAGGIVLLAALVLMLRFAVRPQVFSYFLFAVLLVLLESTTRRNESGRTRWPRACLWLVVPLFCVWANTHGGFVAGGCVLVLYLTGRFLSELRSENRRAAFSLGLTYFGIALAAAAATLLNPYGWNLHAWLMQSLGSPRPEITEWHAPTLNWVLAPYWVAVLLALMGIGFTKRPRDLAHLLVLAATLWQSFSHVRFIAFFIIAFAMYLPEHLATLLPANKRLNNNHENLLRSGVAAGLAVVLLILLAALPGKLKGIEVDRAKYPVAALHYMAENEVTGKLIVDFAWAQYTIAALGVADGDPAGRGVQVAFDGRFRTCYPQEIVDAQFDFALGLAPRTGRFRRSASTDTTRILQLNDPELVLVRRKNLQTQIAMQQSAGWGLLYQDDLAQLWGRTEIFDMKESPRYLPPQLREITTASQAGLVAWPALPTRKNKHNRFEILLSVKETP